MNSIKLILILYISIIYSQVGIQITQTSSIASGEQIEPPFPANPEFPILTDYKINENLFDINATYKDFYLYTQLEYSDSPIFGYAKTDVKDLLNLFTIEYNGAFNLKLGDIHSIESRGLLFNSYQDQSTDFDNGLKGMQVSYGLSWIDMDLIYGSDEYEFRSNPVNQTNDYTFDHTTTFMGSTIYPNDNITLNLQYQNQTILIPEDVINYYKGIFTSILGRDISSKSSEFENDNIDNYNIVSDVLGLSMETSFLGIDFYGEYAKNKYTKLQPSVEIGEKVDGSLFYSSLYADVFGSGVTYEFKRYDTPYFLPTLSYGPIVYREATSTLQSKVIHNMNFVNEIGHQIDINQIIGDNINLNFNLSTARRIHPFDGQLNYTSNTFDSTSFINSYESDPGNTISQFSEYLTTANTEPSLYTYSNPNFMSVLFMDKDEDVLAFWPYRQFYAGISGDLFDDRLYFSFAYDIFDHIKQWGGESEYGMTHNIYNISGIYDVSGNNYINDFISNYWVSEYITWDTTAYWEDFNFWIDLGLDSLNAHTATEDQNGFSIDDYNNIENVIINAQEEFSDSVYLYTPTNNKWFYDSERAITIPTSFAWTFDNGNSVLIYLEQQWREKESNKDIRYISGEIDLDGSSLEKSNEQYVSFTYKNRKFGTFTLSLNKEKFVKTSSEPIFENSKRWDGLRWTYNFHQKESNNYPLRYLLGDSKVSIFYGSQKGGLVCANGICATQPEFLDGVKLNYIRMF